MDVEEYKNFCKLRNLSFYAENQSEFENWLQINITTSQVK